MQQVFHTWIWGSSDIPPCRSSPVLSGWMVNVGGQPFLGLSRDAQLGLSQGSGWAIQDSHGVVVKPLLRYFSCVLRVIVLLEGKPSAQSEVPEHSGEGFHPAYPCTWPHSSFPRLQPVVLSLQLKTPPHSICCHPPCFTVGTVLDRVMSSSLVFLHTYRLELRPKSSILVSSDQRILFVTILESSMRAFMCLATEERLRRATLP